MSDIADDNNIPIGFESLVSVRLHMLVSINERAANSLYMRKYGINLLEWRILGILGERGTLTVNQVAKGSDIDKSQVSRTAVSLVKRRLISRKANKADARSVLLSLTPMGHANYLKIVKEEAAMRQEKLLHQLGESERQFLNNVLDKMIAQAREMYEEEKQMAQAQQASG